MLSSIRAHIHSPCHHLASLWDIRKVQRWSEARLSLGLDPCPGGRGRSARLSFLRPRCPWFITAIPVYQQFGLIATILNVIGVLDVDNSEKIQLKSSGVLRDVCESRLTR